MGAMRGWRFRSLQVNAMPGGQATSHTTTSRLLQEYCFSSLTCPEPAPAHFVPASPRRRLALTLRSTCTGAPAALDHGAGLPCAPAGLALLELHRQPSLGVVRGLQQAAVALRRPSRMNHCLFVSVALTRREFAVVQSALFDPTFRGAEDAPRAPPLIISNPRRHISPGFAFIVNIFPSTVHASGTIGPSLGERCYVSGFHQNIS